MDRFSVGTVCLEPTPRPVTTSPSRPYGRCKKPGCLRYFAAFHEPAQCCTADQMTTQAHGFDLFDREAVLRAEFLQHAHIAGLFISKAEVMTDQYRAHSQALHQHIFHELLG